MRLSVAPMVDVSSLWFRHFHRILSPHAEVYSPMIHARAILHAPDRILPTLSDINDPLVAVQIAGNNPTELYDAIVSLCHFAKSLDSEADTSSIHINLNCGCPSVKANDSEAGAVLMLPEKQFASKTLAPLMERISQLDNAPLVTVKCRTGADEHDSYEYFRHFVDECSATGVDTFIVHTRKCWLKGVSPHQNRTVPALTRGYLHRLREERPELILHMNGAFKTIQHIRDNSHGMQGVMFGRLAREDPFFFARVCRHYHSSDNSDEAFASDEHGDFFFDDNVVLQEMDYRIRAMKEYSKVLRAHFCDFVRQMRPAAWRRDVVEALRPLWHCSRGMNRKMDHGRPVFKKSARTFLDTCALNPPKNVLLRSMQSESVDAEEAEEDRELLGDLRHPASIVDEIFLRQHFVPLRDRLRQRIELAQ